MINDKETDDGVEVEEDWVLVGSEIVEECTLFADYASVNCVCGFMQNGTMRLQSRIQSQMSSI